MIFFSKTLIVVAVVTAAVLFSISYIVADIDDYFQNFMETSPVATSLRGGPEFWAGVEQKLYKLADAPDLPPQKKEQIIKALAKISAKYRPYAEALFFQPKSPSAAEK